MTLEYEVKELWMVDVGELRRVWRVYDRTAGRFAAVCDWVFYRLCDADRNYDSPYGSAKATARMVERAAGNLIEPEERVGALPGRRGPWSAGRRVSRVRSDEPGGGPCAAHVGE